MFVTVDTDEDDHRRVIEFLGLKGEPLPTMRIIQVTLKCLNAIDKYLELTQNQYNGTILVLRLHDNQHNDTYHNDT
jgi:hypothetical protein